MASEWLSSGFGLPATYGGTEYLDGGAGLTLCTQFSPIKAGWITKLRFWKVSTDTATSRTVGIYDVADKSLVTSEVTTGEPVGTGQWIEVTFTTPMPVVDATVFTNNFYAAVEMAQLRYAATGGQFGTVGYYSTPDAAMYSPSTAESNGLGGNSESNGAFIYSADLDYPDDSFGGGYYWVDVLWTDEDPDGPPPSSLPESFQSDAFQGDTFEANILAQFALVEGPDLAEFYTTSTTQFSFNIAEGEDLAAFAVIARTYVSFNISEGPDLAAFDLTSTTQFSFDIVEGPDIPAFNVLTGARFSFDLVEGPDVPLFRVWHGDFTLGDADYIVVPYENKTALVPFDNAQTELMPSDDTTSLPDEWQRVDVDQTRGRRKK